MSGDNGHHGTIAPFLFCVASAVMFIGLVMATAGGEKVNGAATGDTGYWFIFFFLCISHSRPPMFGWRLKSIKVWESCRSSVATQAHSFLL